MENKSLITNRCISILETIRSGKYYNFSNERKILIESYKDIVQNLSQEEFFVIKTFIIKELKNLIKERNERKISYSTLSQIIQYSCCKDNDNDIYFYFEKEILELVYINKSKNFEHFLNLTKLRFVILNDISELEDIFINKYLQKNYKNKINFDYLMSFTINISSSNKIKFLRHLIKNKPYANEYIIKLYILQHSELDNYNLLL